MPDFPLRDKRARCLVNKNHELRLVFQRRHSYRPLPSRDVYIGAQLFPRILEDTKAKWTKTPLSHTGCCSLQRNTFSVWRMNWNEAVKDLDAATHASPSSCTDHQRLSNKKDSGMLSADRVMPGPTAKVRALFTLFFSPHRNAPDVLSGSLWWACDTQTPAERATSCLCSSVFHRLLKGRRAELLYGYFHNSLILWLSVVLPAKGVVFLAYILQPPVAVKL